MAIRKRQFLSVICLSMLLASCGFGSQKKGTASTTAHPPTESSTSANQEHINDEAHRSKSRYDNIWQRISAGYGLPTVSDSKVSSNLKWYSKNQSYFNRFSTQAEPYLYYVVSQMEANDIPLELALIPIIESSYNPHVMSPSNTVGIWQFVPGTAKNFGLKQNNWYNGRKDVIASTDAAIRYIKSLGNDFDHDWLLVVAAYNAGEGTVKNAIEKNKRAGKPTDFWSLQLPKHTQTYIPQLIALSKVIAEPARYNLTLNDIPDAPYFVKINVDKQINLSQAAKQANIDPNELKKLNSGINGWLTPPLGSALLVPVADAKEFSLQLNSLPKIEPAAIAAESQNQPQKINPSKKNSGQEQPAYHTVKSGENLWSIAKAQKISVAKLVKLNNIASNSVLKPGQKLRIAN